MSPSRRPMKNSPAGTRTISAPSVCEVVRPPFAAIASISAARGSGGATRLRFRSPLGVVKGVPQLSPGRGNDTTSTGLAPARLGGNLLGGRRGGRRGLARGGLRGAPAAALRGLGLA